MPIQSFEIGTTYAGRVNVETLTTTPNFAPASSFYAYGESNQTGARSYAIRGASYALWRWSGFMPIDLYNALRVICSGGSVSVVIRTLQADYATYAYYSATMIWPNLTEYEYLNGMYRGLVFKFDNLTSYVP